MYIGNTKLTQKMSAIIIVVDLLIVVEKRRQRPVNSRTQISGHFAQHLFPIRVADRREVPMACQTAMIVDMGSEIG
jgi:hypothetical protein